MSAMHETAAGAKDPATDVMFQVVIRAAEVCKPHSPPGTLIDSMRSQAVLHSVYSELESDTVGRTESYIMRGAMIYIRDASLQAGDIVNAERKVISSDLQSSEDIRAVLLASTGITRIFGGVTDLPKRPIYLGGQETNDSFVLRELVSPRSRDKYFSFDEAAGRVKLTADGIALLRPHLGTGKRCPALNLNIDTPQGDKVSLFNTFAEDVVHRYVNRFVAPKLHLPYTRARFLS